MVKGLTLGKADEGAQRVAKESSSVELLAQHRALEVTRHRVAAGRHFYLDGASEWVGFEFLYVIRGTLTLSSGDDKKAIHEGEYFHHHGLSERAYFRVDEDIELLMVSSPPSYHLVKDEIQEMLTLARSVEEKDGVTEGHCHRLDRLAIRTGEQLGLSGQRLIDLSYGAYLHDVGKVRVPDGILNKPDRLTNEESVEMRRHPEYGAAMLREKSFLGAAAQIVLCHHENYDGSGYPQGLRGEEIPMGARVVSVVDAYDAITSDRPYRGAGTKSGAVQELRLRAGTQFDPRVVWAFLSVIGEDELA